MMVIFCLKIQGDNIFLGWNRFVKWLLICRRAGRRVRRARHTHPTGLGVPKETRGYISRYFKENTQRILECNNTKSSQYSFHRYAV